MSNPIEQFAVSTNQATRSSLLDAAIDRAREYFFTMQHDEGYWEGELEGDTILESDYAILLAFLGRADDSKIRKLANYIRLQQNNEGGWSIYPGGPTELSASIKAYWTLKLAGHAPDEPFMRKACERILALGGVTRANTFTKIYLCVLGLYEWSGVPAVPPAMILLPNWFYINIYEASSWSRAILVPLSIVWAKKPTCHLPERANINELFVGGREHANLSLTWDRKIFTWRNFFLTVDLAMKIGAALHLTPARDKAIRECEKWMLERFAGTHGLAAIFPPMVNACMALKALGYADDDARVRWMLNEIEKLEVDEGETLRLQPCFSVVWDTAIALNALAAAEVEPNHPAIQRAGRWLLSKEVREAGDWKVKTPRAEPGGWYFEFENEFYPDVDDTAMVLMALARVQLDAEFATNGKNGNGQDPGYHNGNGYQNGNGHNGNSHNGNNHSGNGHNGYGHNGYDRDQLQLETLRMNVPIYTDDARVAAMQRGLAWLLQMQNKDGGWASFDKDNNKWILTQVPFADHNAMIDPSTADITGRVLEMLALLAQHDYPSVQRAIDRAIDYLKRDQCADGSWFGRWGVNYIYGTWQVLRGLSCIGEDMQANYIVAAANWLRSIQNEDGGWGESCKSYEDPKYKAQGASTASQTAWALMGLFAVGDYDSDAVQRGTEYLLAHQNADGTWSDASWTGAGFPRVFYLRYHLYQDYFPLMALGMYRAHRRETSRVGFVVTGGDR